MKKLALLLAAAATLAGGAAQASIVNIDALNSTGTTLSLGPGTYTVTNVGTAGGGAYDGWNPWSTVTGCDTGGAHCATGWGDYFAIDLGGGNGSYYGYNGGGYFATAGQAFAAWGAGPNFVVPLAQYTDPNAYSALTGPIKFTLAAAQNVRFFIIDYPYGDNSGGMSLDVTLDRVAQPGAVPEPATWALMIGGFGLVGAATRARRRRFA